MNLYRRSYAVKQYGPGKYLMKDSMVTIYITCSELYINAENNDEIQINLPRKWFKRFIGM